MTGTLPDAPYRTPLRRGKRSALATVSLAEGLEALRGRGGVLGDLDPAALEIGMAVRRLRKNRGLTQAKLEQATGISQAALSAIERGQGRDGPSYRVLRDIARALGVDLADLLDAQISDNRPGRVLDDEEATAGMIEEPAPAITASFGALRVSSVVSTEAIEAVDEDDDDGAAVPA